MGILAWTSLALGKTLLLYGRVGEVLVDSSSVRILAALQPAVQLGRLCSQPGKASGPPIPRRMNGAEGLALCT